MTFVCTSLNELCICCSVHIFIEALECPWETTIPNWLYCVLHVPAITVYVGQDPLQVVEYDIHYRNSHVGICRLRYRHEGNRINSMNHTCMNAALYLYIRLHCHNISGQLYCILCLTKRIHLLASCLKFTIIRPFMNVKRLNTSLQFQDSND